MSLNIIGRGIILTISVVWIGSQRIAKEQGVGESLCGGNLHGLHRSNLGVRQLRS